jgi:hypothetical protein
MTSSERCITHCCTLHELHIDNSGSGYLILKREEIQALASDFTKRPLVTIDALNIALLFSVLALGCRLFASRSSSKDAEKDSQVFLAYAVSQLDAVITSKASIRSVQIMIIMVRVLMHNKYSRDMLITYFTKLLHVKNRQSPELAFTLISSALNHLQTVECSYIQNTAKDIEEGDLKIFQVLSRILYTEEKLLCLRFGRMPVCETHDSQGGLGH